MTEKCAFIILALGKATRRWQLQDGQTLADIVKEYCQAEGVTPYDEVFTICLYDGTTIKFNVTTEIVRTISVEAIQFPAEFK